MTRARAAAAAAALALALAGAPRLAAGLEGLPGSTWGDLSQELPDRGDADAILEGWIRQGIAWRRWPAGAARLVLQTYGTLRYRWDGLGLDWNNHLAPGAGAALDVVVPRMPLVTGGVEYVHEWRFRSGTAAPYTAVFVDWYHWWDVRSGRWPGATWGDVRWALPDAGRENLVAEGWVRQGVVVARWAPGALALALSPYVRARWKVDTLGLDWNNHAGPGAGVALDLDGLRGCEPGVAAEYVVERYFRSGATVHRVELVLRWYAWWDLTGR